MVPEPIGSTHLRFGDARVVMGNCIWLMKVVRSPRCDHGHDEESRNGRDIKNDILEDVIRTPDKYRSAGRVIGTTGEVMGTSKKRHIRDILG